VAAAVAVLASSATREQKVNACRRLAAVGGQESIAPLAALLADSELAHAARMALEAIPDPAAGEALCAALPNLTDLPLVGAMQSLAARREAAAVSDLGRYLNDADPQVVAAACTALGTIASPEAIALLENGRSSIIDAARTEWGLAVLRGVSVLRQRGSDDQALRLCHLLRESAVPPHVRQAATRFAVLIQPVEAGPLLQELLTAQDSASFAMGLTVSRELTEPSVTQTLLKCLGTLAADRRVQVMRTLGDRGDVAARDALLEYARANDQVTRTAALAALGQTGDASVIPLLLDAIGDADAGIVVAARHALVSLQGESVDAAISEALSGATGPLRVVLIDVIGARQIKSAAGQLKLLVDDPDAATRLAALTALGQVIDPPDLSVLTVRLPTATDDKERAAIQQSLRVACRRASDRDACVRELKGAAGLLGEDFQPFLIELLAVVGNAAAREAIESHARDRDDAIQDAASGALGRWRTPDVAPALLELARAARQEKIRIRALRGYLRVIRQMDLTDADKLTMYRQAQDAATRDEERLLAVETLGRIPTPEALAEAIKQLESESLRAAACAAAVSIAEPLAASQPAAVAEAMQRVLANTNDPELTRRAQAALEAGNR
jgi:HEAT repeat protein